MICYRRTEGLSGPDYDAVERLLVECDGDFVPKLSERHGTMSKDLKGHANDGMDVYMADLSVQVAILAYDEDTGRLAGFVSYRLRCCPVVVKRITDSIAYASTMAVSHEYRGMGIPDELYKRMIADCDQMGLHIIARTWSTNEKSIYLLEKHGFERVVCMAGDRGPGIDTIYFGRSCCISEKEEET